MTKEITYYRGSVFSGQTEEIAGASVVYVKADVQADITYKPLAVDFESGAKNKYFAGATRRRYKTLEAAVKAVLK